MVPAVGIEARGVAGCGSPVYPQTYPGVPAQAMRYSPATRRWRVSQGRGMKLWQRISVFLVVPSLLVSPAFAQDDYAAALAKRPLPTDDAGRRAECAWIRQEAARLQNMLIAMDQQQGVPGPYNFQPIYRAAAQQRVNSAGAALASRASEVGCAAAFSNAPAPQAAPPSAPAGMSFDECFQKCKQYTSRTNEECFDSCKGSSSWDAPTQARPAAPWNGRPKGASCATSAQCDGQLLCVDSTCVEYKK